MDYYKVLGIDENATKEEIQKAYESQVKKYKEEIKDEKRAEQFLNVFKEAYDELMKKKNFEEMFDKDDNFEGNEQNSNTYNIQNNSYDIHNSYSDDYLEDDYDSTYSKEDYYDNDYDDYDDYDEEDYYEEDYYDEDDNHIKKHKKNRKRSKRGSNSSNLKSNNRKENKYDRDKNKEREKRIEKSRKDEEESSFSLIKIPFKILAIPLIALLSLIIVLIKIISFATWLVSKVIMAISIGVASIHCYQIYIGQPKDYRIFAICILGAVLALILPFVVKILPKPLEGLNNSLKDFVMDR